jgi:hypothetical protein
MPDFMGSNAACRSVVRVGTDVDVCCVGMMTQEAPMQSPYATAVTRFSTAALIGIGAIAATGCNSGTPVAAAPSTAFSAAAAAPGATPIAVNCGPGQQALIRPSLIAGQTIAQVDCVPASGMPGAATVGYPGVGGAPMAAAYYDAPRVLDAPVAYRPAARPVSYRTASAPRVVQRRSVRSWQKSAVIIGSSAGIGAGVGGAVKGKKGALLGAAIGGGAATLWDQVTRRK